MEICWYPFYLIHISIYLYGIKDLKVLSLYLFNSIKVDKDLLTNDQFQATQQQQKYRRPFVLAIRGVVVTTIKKEWLRYSSSSVVHA